jgi:ferric-dicitrate binding protein FerR (iron transport regulator)
MYRETEEGAIQSDAYIDALLSDHARLPVALPVADDAPAPDVRHAIRTLERGLPRFHPSFLFEERLADQLRALAEARHEGPSSAPVVIERRVFIGGAIASGVSLAGAAMWAWRHRPRSATGVASSSAAGQD